MDYLTFLDTYNLETLTDTVNHVPEIPSVLSRYFEKDYIETTRAFIDMQNEGVALVPDTPRSSAGPNESSSDKRSGVPITAAHLLQTDAVYADDIQNERAFGTTSLTNVDMKVLKKISNMRRNIEATLEYHRVGAVCGKVLDADGSTVLYDLPKIFGVLENGVQTINWPASSTGKNNPLLAKLDEITDAVESAVAGNVTTGIVAIVGKDFWSYLTTNPFTRDAFNMWMARQNGYGDIEKQMPFMYGGIEWIRYNKVVGGQTLVASDEAHVFPVGPGMLKHYFAPADYMDSVNRPGLEFYARSEPGRMSRSIDIEVQSNPITIHKFPEALFTIKGVAG